MALCAAEQGKFWRADRWLFAHANPRKNPDILRMIDDLSLEDAKFKGCYSKPSTFERANAEHVAAQKAKLVEVPGYLVDGQRYRAHEFGELLKTK
jgi:hypothetical protein